MKIAGENHYRQNEIRHRPGDDDGRALAHRLKHEAFGALGLVHAGETRAARNARGVVIAEKLDESAERDRGNLPAGSIAIVEADNFRAEPYRKQRDAHAAPAGDQKMAQLVEEDDDAQHEQERDDVASNAAAKRMQMLKIFDPMMLECPAQMMSRARFRR